MIFEVQKSLKLKQIYNNCKALVAHTCNPSYSGGRDQEDRRSKPDGANDSRDPILKKSFTLKIN
jgi:hypothetical protein